MSFLSTLRHELPRWVGDGLIDKGQADAISDRYALDDVRDDTAGLLLPAIYIVGACLVGGGAISFVAAHWDTIPIPLRLALLLGVMLGCEISGYVLWKVKGRRQKLGQALVALGALLFGANVFLIAQMYHLQGPPHGAFGLWTLGALAVAYSTMSSPAMLLASVTGFVWANGWIEAHPHDPCWYPIVLCIACIPFLQRRCALTLTGLLFAAGAAASVCAARDSGESWAVYLTLAGLGALYRGLGLWLRGSERARDMAAPAMFLGGAVVLLPAYMLSFAEGPGDSVVKHLWESEGWSWTVLLGLIYAAAIVSWVVAIRRVPTAGVARSTHFGVLAAALLLPAGILTGHEVVLSVMANLALLGVAGTLLQSAVTRGQRQEFWMGLMLLALVIVSRFLEWDTHLMVKSAVFVLCGLGVIFGGARFEKHLKGGHR